MLVPDADETFKARSAASFQAAERLLADPVRACGGWDVSGGRGFGIIYHDLGQFVTPKRRQMCIHIHVGGTSEIATCSAKAALRPPAGLILPSTTGQQEQEAGPWGPPLVPLLLPGAFWMDLARSSILGACERIRSPRVRAGAALRPCCASGGKRPAPGLRDIIVECFMAVINPQCSRLHVITS